MLLTDVTMNDRGLYSCNLHHLYCHLYETVRVQLNVTKSRECPTLHRLSASSTHCTVKLSQFGPFCFLQCYNHAGRKEQRFWDGQKAVFVVLLGSTVALPCINRRNVWTDWSNDEGDQQVKHEPLSSDHRVYVKMDDMTTPQKWSRSVSMAIW